MKEVAQLLREIILDADKMVGEEIAWNAPLFYYTGKIKSCKIKISQQPFWLTKH